MGRTTEKPPTGTVPRIPEADSFEHRGRTIQIVRQDCIDFLRSLPDSSVDLIVTDPAYSGMNRKLKLGHGRIVGKYQNRGEGGKWFKEFDDTEENYSAFLSECRRILRDEVGHIYIMFDSFSLLSLGAIVREYFDVKNLLVWDKVHFGMGHYYRRRHEFIIFGTSGNTRKIRNHSFPDVWRFKRIYRPEYSTQKPVELFQAMIYASGEKGFVVCDPFMGVGSSTVAAMKNDCHFVGCDISKEAVDLAVERVTTYIGESKDPLQPRTATLSDVKVFWEEQADER